MSGTVPGGDRGQKATRRLIRVAYVIGTLDVGGAERQLGALSTGLDRSRFEPVVLCLSGLGPLAGTLVAAGIRVKSFDLGGLSVWRDALRVVPRLVRFARAMRRETATVVHGFLFHGYVLGALLGRLVGVPVVIASRRSLGNFKAGRPHYRVLERLANRLTDLVIANSEAVRQDVIRGEGLAGSKVIVIRNGLAADRLVPRADGSLRAECALEGKGPVVGVVANFIRYKGHRFFLDAWLPVMRRFPDGVAILVGDGLLRPELEARVDELGIRESVRFLGTRRDVQAILAMVDLVVHPSLEEGFSNALLEAMAAAKPVVATEVGGTPEAVVHGETGLLVPPRDSGALTDAMLRILAHPEEARLMGEAGRRRVMEHFALDVMVRRYERVYEGLVAQRCSDWEHQVDAG